MLRFCRTCGMQLRERDPHSYLICDVIEAARAIRDEALPAPGRKMISEETFSHLAHALDRLYSLTLDDVAALEQDGLDRSKIPPRKISA